MNDKIMHRATMMVRKHHAGQKDKCGEPYIGHVERVAYSAMSINGNKTAFVVGLLHDIVEDTDVSLKEIYEKFGNKIYEAIDAISHRPHEPYVDYMNRVERNHLATIVKMADLLDNMSPKRCVAIKSDRDFERTAKILLPRYAKAYRRLARLTGEFNDA